MIKILLSRMLALPLEVCKEIFPSVIGHIFLRTKMLEELALVFICIEALQGSLPDITCETDVNIVFLSLAKKKF